VPAVVVSLIDELLPLLLLELETRTLTACITSSFKLVVLVIFVLGVLVVLVLVLCSFATVELVFTVEVVEEDEEDVRRSTAAPNLFRPTVVPKLEALLRCRIRPTASSISRIRIRLMNIFDGAVIY
jgi:hypothetical protein